MTYNLSGAPLHQEQLFQREGCSPTAKIQVPLSPLTFSLRKARATKLRLQRPPAPRQHHDRYAPRRPALSLRARHRRRRRPGRVPERCKVAASRSAQRPSARGTEDQAFVTLTTNNAYAKGALVLGSSLKQHRTSRRLAVLTTPQVSDSMRKALEVVFDEVITVDILDSGDSAHLTLKKRPELGITLTKLHCWSLTQYSKCVFMDADTLVLKNIDDLFEREELSAASDPGWPDCFNSGVFVYQPSVETYNQLLRCAAEQGSFDGMCGDKGLLNTFFSSWATTDIRKHLPFIYNLSSISIYSYLPAFKA
ncbi:LOW QUALITY PROTEIN: glycogenin-1-like [Ochotona princeps]|uniref:LOW QUALITY PROTEIN: glycogenin-1-like n=1 Tax=Ochotona princeps TaxID=9978 RepID=UPI002714C1AC|nr:LOW QUALITY PROTEIN: glycogenin-1-like [Ochotona princeps]